MPLPARVIIDEHMKMSSYVRVARPPAQGARRPRAAAARDTCEVDIIHAGAVQIARRAQPHFAALGRVAAALDLMSNSTRLRILFALQPRVRRGPELCVCDLAAVVGASKSLVSHQLRLLRAAGLVWVRRSGKLAYYRLADGPMVALVRKAFETAHSEAKRTDHIDSGEYRDSSA